MGGGSILGISLRINISIADDTQINMSNGILRCSIER